MISRWILTSLSKSMANLVKHGINFKDAQQLWEDSGLRVIEARTAGESRWICPAPADQTRS